MTEMSTLSKVAVSVSIAALTAGVVYYLFRKEEQPVVAAKETAAPSCDKVESCASSCCPPSKGKVDFKKITVEKLLEVMDKIVASQQVMKDMMKDVTKDIIEAKMSFIQTYDKIKDVQPVDPIEEAGLSMHELDEFLEKYQNDPRVMEAIARIVGPSDEDLAADSGKVLSVHELIEIHQYMLSELNGIASEIKSKKNKHTELDPRTITVAAQVMVGAKVEDKFKVVSQEVERSVMLHQAQLQSNHQFATINMGMQNVMGELMGVSVERE